MRPVFLLTLLPFLLAADTDQAAVAVDSDCMEYSATHTLVRNDVLSQLKADRDNLKTAKPLLDQAQKDLQAAKAELLQAEKDLKAQEKALKEFEVAVAKYKANQDILNRHITKLEGMTCPDPTIGDQLARGWEEVDGVVGIGAGYVLGTGMCVGMAWVFNQPALTR